jgi:hypothetical protein
MADELPPSWKNIFDDMPMLGTSDEPYVAATNVRPIGPSTWPSDWHDHASYGPMPLDETASCQ